jgi:hypothetical protein
VYEPPLWYRTGIVKNSYTGTTLNAAQLKEVDVAMLPAAVLAKKASARGSQINTQGDTTLKPILPSIREAMLNQQHAAVFEQQRLLLAESEQRMINCQQATIAVLQFVIPSPLICWQSWPRNILRRPKEEQNQYCCHSYLQYMVKKRNLFKPQVMSKPPHGDRK